jgi:hypothetical protein
MDREHAELSSVAAMVDEALGRVTASAERLAGSGGAGAASDLFEVERTLAQALRRLEAVVRTMSRPA